MKTILYLIFCLLLATCVPKGIVTKSEMIKQGITGKVIWVEGNQMPGMNKKNDNALQGKPVVREIHIYKLVNIRDTESENAFFSQVKGNLVKKVSSDKTGIFQAALPIGEYSIFIKEGEHLYANIFDGNNNVFPVVVNEDKITNIQIKIDYNAAY